MVVTPSNVSAIKQCFSDLVKAETSGDYDKALKTANKSWSFFLFSGFYEIVHHFN